MTDTYTIAPLVFIVEGKDGKFPGDLIANSIFGQYRIQKYERRFTIELPDGRYGDRDTLESAEAACQSDYEARLEQCLVLVERIDCRECKHRGIWAGHFKHEPPFRCLKFDPYEPLVSKPFDLERIRLGPCDNGRNGDKKS